MSRTAIVAISRRGADLARALSSSLTGENTLYLERRLAGPGDDAASLFDLPLRPLIHRLFDEYQALVLFMPVGAAVRLVAPRLSDKHEDPAVVCVDDAGRFVVSLLSGHVGGADRLAQEVATILGAMPVITSASHVMGTLAVDLLGQEFGWTLEAESLAVTRASACVVNGELVGMFQEAGEPDWWPEDRPLPDNIKVFDSLKALASAPVAAALVITDRLGPGDGAQTYQEVLGDRIVVLHRPRSLVVGMGCRRGVPLEELEELLVDTFRRSNLSAHSLNCIATADLKRDEPGIRALADKYSVPLICYSSEELNSMFERRDEAAGNSSVTPRRSEKAYTLLGIWGVAEPAALLAAGGQELLVPRQKTSRATIAIAHKRF